MNNLIIRECNFTDLDRIVSLQQLWKTEDITYGYAPVAKSKLEEKIGKYFYVAELSNEIIGYIYGSVNVAENIAVFNDGQTYFEVEDIFISLNNRDSGYGSLLLDMLLSIAKKNGVERSMIYSSTKNIEDVLKFYQKHDYKTWYIQMFK